ncbi:hypothetical protein GCM10010517_49610 [Streptosporangium fragile]|uniref:Uncharacterized protein n=1 Tax=Streptosporangium fragile TaxID=46186 RepID=A0ABN3W2J6_9ACTN
MLGKLFTVGALTASTLMAPAVVAAAPLLTPSGAAASVATSTGENASPAVAAAPTEWKRGQSFPNRESCLSYGDEGHHGRWKCSQEGDSWAYWYWNS